MGNSWNDYGCNERIRYKMDNNSKNMIMLPGTAAMLPYLTHGKSRAISYFHNGYRLQHVSYMLSFFSPIIVRNRIKSDGVVILKFVSSPEIIQTSIEYL